MTRRDSLACRCPDMRDAPGHCPGWRNCPLQEPLEDEDEALADDRHQRYADERDDEPGDGYVS